MNFEFAVSTKVSNFYGFISDCIIRMVVVWLCVGESGWVRFKEGQP